MDIHLQAPCLILETSRKKGGGGWFHGWRRRWQYLQSNVV